MEENDWPEVETEGMDKDVTHEVTNPLPDEKEHPLPEKQ